MYQQIVILYRHATDSLVSILLRSLRCLIMAEIGRCSTYDFVGGSANWKVVQHNLTQTRMYIACICHYVQCRKKLVFELLLPSQQ